MKTYKKLLVSDEEYIQIKNTQFDNGSIVKEHFKGSRINMFSDNLLIASKCKSANLEKGELSDSKFSAFLGMFNKQLYRQFALNPALFFLEVDFDESSRKKNHETWKSINEGDFFYNIDLSSAYWQIAHKIGYIGDNIFKKYMKLDEYKEVKRYCISFLGRKNKMKYYVNGTEFEIECDKEFANRVYKNIRYALYNYIVGGVKLTNNWLEYNIDGISVLEHEKDTIINYFKECNLEFKINECIKMSESEYLYKNRLRTFKHTTKNTMK